MQPNDPEFDQHRHTGGTEALLTDETAETREEVQPTEDPELFSDTDSAGFRERWHEVQAAFVDSPREAVQDADELVAELMRSLASTFNEHKQQLEGAWQRGDDVATEDLRQAFQRYRTFFNQLLKH